jgi:hypothetical protein
MMKLVAILLALFGASPAQAANTQAEWGVNRTVSPWQFCAYDQNFVCQPVFSLTAASGGPVWLGATTVTNLSGLGTGVATALGIAPNTPGGFLTSFAIGAPVTGCSTSGYILYNNAGALGCTPSPGGGNVFNSGTPANTQLAQWINATQIQGLTIGSGVATTLGKSTNATGGIITGVYNGNNEIAIGGGLPASSGSYNSAIGYGALYSNTTGGSNSAVGANALNANTTGGANSAVGFNALNTNTTGTQNSAVGFGALNTNTTGAYNSAVGVNALAANTTGGNNSAVGVSALYSNTTGGNNSAVGLNTLFGNTTGGSNSAVGDYTLYDLGQAQTAGAFTVGISYTIKSIGTTDFTLIGAASNTIGIIFTASGVGSGTGTATPNANNNTAIGFNTGRGIIYGSNNTIIGAQVSGLASGLSGAVIIATGDGTSRADYNVTRAGKWSFTALDLSNGTGLPISTINYTAAGAASPQTLNFLLGELVQLDSYKYAGDTSDCAAFQRAHDNNYGATILLPARQLEMGTNSISCQVNITHSVRFLGQGSNEAATSGTVLHIPNTTYSPFYFNGTSATGAGISNVGVKQDQPSSISGWTPTVYPPVFQVSNVGGSVSIWNIIGGPVYALINNFNSGRADDENIKVECLTYCISSDAQYDKDFYNHIENWPFWSVNQTNPSYIYYWKNTHSDAIILNRVDTPTVTDVFNIFGRSVVRFSNAGNGVTTRGVFQAIQADSSKYAIWVDNTASTTSNHFNSIDGQHIDGSANGATLATSGAAGTATVTFASNATIPVGTSVTIAGVTPAGYNGTYAVTASSSGSVSYTNATTGAQTVAGTLSSSPSLAGSNTIQIDAGSSGNVIQYNQMRSQYAAQSVINNLSTSNLVFGSTILMDYWGNDGGSEAAFNTFNGATSQILPGRVVNNAQTSTVFTNATTDWVSWVQNISGTDKTISTGPIQTRMQFQLAGTPALLTAGSTLYADSAAANASEGQVCVPTSFAGTFKNLSMGAVAAPSAGQTFVITLRINGVSQAVTCTISNTGQTCTDATHSAAISANVCWDISMVASAGATTSILHGSIEFDAP